VAVVLVELPRVVELVQTVFPVPVLGEALLLEALLLHHKQYQIMTTF